MSLHKSNIQNTFSISRFNEYYLPSVNRSVFESIDSKTLYDKKFKSDFAKEDMLQVVTGLDSGLLVNYLLEQGIPKGSIFIFVELDEVLNLLNVDIPKEIENQLFIYNYEDFQENFSSDTYGVYILKNHFKHYRSLGATSSHLPEYSILNTQIIKTLESGYLEQRVNSSQQKYFEEQFKNISENVLPASLLINRFNGHNCLIVAGGPSLDDHIDWIRSNSKHLFIIAVSRIAGKLHKAGIAPHIIVSVDPYDFSFEVNRDMMSLANSSLFVNSFHVNSRLLGQWPGKNLFMDNKYPWQLEEKENIETIGPTVTNAAVHLATRMGFSSILLAGVDLCFTNTGFTHTKDSVESALGPNLGIMGEWIDTYGGEKAETVTQLKLAIDALAAEANINPEIEFINLSLNAAKVNGIKYKNTESIILQIVEPSPEDLLNNIPHFSLEDKRKDNIISKAKINELITTLRNIAKLSNDILSLIQQLKEQTKSPYDMQKYFNKIDIIDKKINKSHSGVIKLIKTYGFSEFSAFLTTKDTEEWDTLHVIDMTENYYKAFISISEKLIELAQDSLARLTHRINELSQNADLEALVNFWRKEKQHGRVNIWLVNHPNWRAHEKFKHNEQLLEKYQHLIQSLSDEYQKQLTVIPEEYIENVKESASMENVFEKIIVLIRDKDHTGLVKMAFNLRELAKKDETAKRLYHLAYSHQLLLEKKENEALLVLLELDKNLQSEIELKQISLLALRQGKIDIAEYAIARLAETIDEYIPQHAHILKLRGKYQDSIDLYLDYLEKYPSDISTWIKFGLFMIDINQFANAETAFYQVLQTDPDNRVAHEYINWLQSRN
ncbi:6-hydroxymethylpterin diphosphokinase MptE-like protein [Shewanella mangrovisoli]|uniref:6-hydroxymethylpterin diphosphokinase MptE-like protein n=1 Tax=Shewanella mangrovisoli TaxID=2864211 RepID=UPI0035B79301